MQPKQLNQDQPEVEKNTRHKHIDVVKSSVEMNKKHTKRDSYRKNSFHATHRNMLHTLPLHSQQIFRILKNSFDLPEKISSVRQCFFFISDSF